MSSIALLFVLPLGTEGHQNCCASSYSAARSLRSTVANGVISILYSNELGGNPVMDGKTVTLTPDTTNAGSIKWTCAIGGDTTRYKYMPSECRN